MRSVSLANLLGLLLVIGFLVSSDVSVAQEPTSPFGQSNIFVLNTNRIGFGTTAIFMISSAPDNSVVPAATSLRSLQPNPFNPRITISFNVGRSGPIELNIYDLVGRRIKTLISEHLETGQYSQNWDGRDNSGSEMPAGIYLVRIKSETTIDSEKMTLLK